MQSDFDKDLQSYFTDMEHLRDMFKNFVSAEKLPKRLIVFHGVGGVGKSSLLRMFRLHCKSEKIPVALASGDDAKSVLDVVTRWAEDLKEDGFKLPSLGKTLETYRAIQAKVDTEAKKTGDQLGNLAGKGVATIGSVLGSMLPGIGPIAGPVIGMGAEALTDWLRGFLKKPEIDLLLDPAKKLTSDFLEDLAKTAEKKRMVLLLDTYEQMSALEDWVGETAQKIHPNVLMVIAGRKLPDWNRVWSGWMMNAQVEELKPMTEDIMRDLIRRYYATMRGGIPDPAQVDAIIKFARGLPMVVTSAVQLWVKYGVEDFQSVKAEIVANLVDRLMEGVPSNLIPALEAAAVVRWFDQPILRAVLNKEDVRDVYNELRRFPFVRSRSEGLALHDSVREMMDENLRVQDSERHAELHERAAVYFEKRLLSTVSDEGTERFMLERIYNRISEDEAKNISIFVDISEGFVRYRLINKLRVLVSDVNTYQLKLKNSQLWLDYYTKKLAHLEKRLTYEDLHLDTDDDIYGKISENPSAELKLHSYALCEMGKVRNDMAYVVSEGGLSRLMRIIERCNEILPELSLKRAENLVTLGTAHSHVGKMDDAIKYFEKAIILYREINDMYGVASVFREIIATYGIRGEWSKMFEARSRGLEQFPDSAKESAVYSGLLSHFGVGRALSGRYREAEEHLQASLAIDKKIGRVDVVGSLEDLALSVGLQGRFSEARKLFLDAMENTYQIFGHRDNPVTLNFFAMVCMKEGKLLEAEQNLLTSFEVNKRLPPRRNPPENLQWLGLLYELMQNWQRSEDYSKKSLEYRFIFRHYYICGAFSSLIRIKYVQGDLAAIPSLLAEAEQLAQQYEYNDHLASLRLTQGHLRAETSEVSETSEVWMSQSVLDYYKQAMIYALRYNRFLLDELLSGRPQGTPLRPIIPYCIEHGEEGKKTLIALRDWWKTGVNDVGAPRPDTISPISEGIPLLEAEKIAREREPGDGSMQRSVAEQLEAVVGE